MGLGLNGLLPKPQLGLHGWVLTPFLKPGTRPEGVGTERSEASAKKCLAGGRRPFRDLSVVETAAPSLSRGVRRGQNSPADKSPKRPGREPRYERKGLQGLKISWQVFTF